MSFIGQLIVAGTLAVAVPVGLLFYEIVDWLVYWWRNGPGR